MREWLGKIRKNTSEFLKRRKETPLWNLFWLLLILFLLVENNSHIFITFTSYWLTFPTALFLLILPILIFINCFYFRNKIIRYLSAFVSFFPALIALPFLAMISFYFLISIAEGRDVTFKKVHQIDLPHSNVSFYEIDLGATSSVTLEARQEMSVFPGVVLVKELYRKEAVYRDNAVKIDDSTIRIDKDEYQLKDYVYF